jgi:hypothetical protein
MKPVKIFVEGKTGAHSTDSAFLRDCIYHWFGKKIDSKNGFFYIGGADELKIRAGFFGIEQLHSEILLIIDADTNPEARKKEIEEFQSANGLKFPYFLFPDNIHGGEVENLLVEIATNKPKMDCYVAYEKCIDRKLDIKDKIFAYVRAVTGSKESAKDQNRGFINEHFDLSHPSLQPLKKFLEPYF